MDSMREDLSIQLGQPLSLYVLHTILIPKALLMAKMDLARRDLLAAAHECAPHVSIVGRDVVQEVSSNGLFRGATSPPWTP